MAIVLSVIELVDTADSLRDSSEPLRLVVVDLSHCTWEKLSTRRRSAIRYGSVFLEPNLSVIP